MLVLAFKAALLITGGMAVAGFLAGVDKRKAAIVMAAAGKIVEA